MTRYFFYQSTRKTTQDGNLPRFMLSWASSESWTRTKYTYDSFGKLTASTGSLVNPFQYTARGLGNRAVLLPRQILRQNAGRFLGEVPSGFTDGTNRYVCVGSRPAILMDPTGPLAELYCERIHNLRGGGIFGDVMITLFQAQHCFIRIVSHGKDETFELYGPGEDPKRGTPHINPYNPFRFARRFKVYPPPNMICGEFEVLESTVGLVIGFASPSPIADSAFDNSARTRLRLRGHFNFLSRDRCDHFRIFSDLCTALAVAAYGRGTRSGEAISVGLGRSLAILLLYRAGTAR